MGSLTAATPLNLGAAVGQIAEPQSSWQNLIPNSAYPVPVAGTAWTAGAGATVANATQRYAASYLPGILGSTNGAAGIVTINATITTGIVASTVKALSFDISADTGFTGLSPASPLSRVSFAWTGGTARTDYIEIDPRNGIIGSSSGFTSITVTPYYTRAQDGTNLLIYQVVGVLAAIPAGTNNLALTVLPRIDQPTGVSGEIAFAAPMIVEGDDIGAYVSTSGQGANITRINKALLGQLPRETVAPRFPKVVTAANYRTTNANDAGITLISTGAASSITLQHDTDFLGTDITVVNNGGACVVGIGLAGDLIFGPGLSAAGVTSVTLPSAASFPNAACTFVGEESTPGSGIIYWYITWTNCGVFNSSGIPITPIIAPGGAGTIIRSDGTNWAVSQSTYPDLIASGNVLHATAANTIGSSANFIFSGGILSLRSGSEFSVVSGQNVAYISSAGRYQSVNTGAYLFTNGDAAGGTIDLTMTRSGANAIVFSSGTTGTTAATARTEINKAITGIANNTATATFTVTVPNSAQSASIRVRLTGSLGAGGAIGANESTQDAEYHINVARTAGVNAVATIGAVTTQAAAASVAGAANAATTGTLSAISGAVGATNTFTINVTIARSAGTSDNHTCFAFAELLNANASGVTIA